MSRALSVVPLISSPRGNGALASQGLPIVNPSFGLFQTRLEKAPFLSCRPQPLTVVHQTDGVFYSVVLRSLFSFGWLTSTYNSTVAYSTLSIFSSTSYMWHYSLLPDFFASQWQQYDCKYSYFFQVLFYSCDHRTVIR